MTRGGAGEPAPARLSGPPGPVSAQLTRGPGARCRCPATVRVWRLTPRCGRRHSGDAARAGRFRRSVSDRGGVPGKARGAAVTPRRTRTDLEEGIDMGTDDKISNKAEELKGRAKENIGDLTDDEDLQAEGRADQAEGGLKQAGEKVKDAAGKVKDAFKK
ncbi:hypothetical protein GCM10010486_70210 [Nonomuraea roseoviolacea subsp. carminata]